MSALRRALPAAALLLGAAGLALAAPEGPVPPPVGPEGGSPEEQIQELAKKISRELKENEEALAKLARGEKAIPKGVNIEIPETGSRESSESSSGGT